jgi:membrane glycosyltransferase
MTSTGKEPAGSPRAACGSSLESAGKRLWTYLHRLPLSETRRAELALEVLREVQDEPHQAPDDCTASALRKLWERLGSSDDPSTVPASIPCRRTTMVPESIPRRSWIPLRQRNSSREYLNQPWSKVARRRRMLLGLCILVPTLVAVSTMGSFLPHRGNSPLEMAILVVFTALFAWVSIGFWTATFGFVTLLKGIDRVTVTRDMDRHNHDIRPDVRTALLFPVCDEDMDRVMAGVMATYRSLERAGRIEGFDVHILSDTRDPDAWVAEEAAWKRTCEVLNGHGRIFYRRRRINVKRKSGNIADFCRRNGSAYTYMVVMDADSVMSGQTLARMVSIMERKRNVGILQTAPAVTGRRTLLARTQQFANRAYGPMFAAGLHYMQLGDAQYWGHNAIIRIRPFMKHCALPRLSGNPPLGGDILSHDFVESALMRRAGWGVWLAFDLDGSYEESPPNLLSELKRDRRWCQGNMQHLRLLFTKGLFPAHRALFLNGAMSYISAFLWFLFLVLSSIEAVIEAMLPPEYFPTAGMTLFPEWPVWEPGWALSLLATTGVILFLPKLESLVLLVIKGRTSLFGGTARLASSIVAEILVSSLLAPIRMLFHSKFVFAILMGRVSGWGKQQRDDVETPWSDAVRFHAGGTILSALWGALLYLFNPSFFWWITPILVPLLLAIPLSVLTSRASLGMRARRAGLFLTPEETAPSRELLDLELLHGQNRSIPDPLDIGREHGFLRAVVDPAILAMHRRLVRRKSNGLREPACRELAERALRLGPSSLSAAQRMTILNHPELLSMLHRSVWQLPDHALAQWGMGSFEG